MPTIIREFSSNGAEFFEFSDGVIVAVGDPNVWIVYRPTPGPTGPSDFAYYYADRGYGCKTSQEVAIQYYKNFVS